MAGPVYAMTETWLTAGEIGDRYGPGHGALLSHRWSSAGAGVPAPAPARPLRGRIQCYTDPV